MGPLYFIQTKITKISREQYFNYFSATHFSWIIFHYGSVVLSLLECTIWQINSCFLWIRFNTNTQYNFYRSHAHKMSRIAPRVHSHKNSHVGADCNSSDAIERSSLRFTPWNVLWKKQITYTYIFRINYRFDIFLILTSFFFLVLVCMGWSQ